MDSGAADAREPREDRRHHLRLTVALILWPTILAGAGNMAIVWSGAAGEEWMTAWPIAVIAVHLGVVALCPAAALSVAAGLWVVRSRQPLLVFLIVPLVALVTAGLGVLLHYLLVGALSPRPVVTGVLVVLLSVLVGLILSKGSFPHGR